MTPMTEYIAALLFQGTMWTLIGASALFVLLT